MLRNPRPYLVLVWFSCICVFLMLRIREFSIRVDEPVSPWIFPFLTEAPGNQFFIIAGAILLFCDAPFLNESAGWNILRSGRRSWFWGNFLYILIMALAYSIVISVLPNLFLLPQVKLTGEWGKVLGALAQTGAASEIGIRNLNYSLMVQYTPLLAMFLTVMAVWLNSVLIGMVCFTFNLVAGKGSGIFVSAMIGLTPMLVRCLAKLYVGYYTAPPMWMDISVYNWNGYGKFPSVWYIYAVLLGLIVALSIAGYIGMRTKDLHMTEEI